MTGSLALLIVLVLFGSLSAAENDDSLIVPFSNQDMTSVIEGLVRERMAEIESEFKQENADLKHDITVLKNEFELSEIENRVLKTKVDYIENELEILKAASSRSPPAHPEKDTEDVKEDNVSRRVAPFHPSAPQVAFQAEVNQKLTNVGPQQIITFDAVQVNIGNNYNSATSIFTCEIPGLYVFHLTVMTYIDKYVELFFMKNGQSMHGFYIADKGFNGAGSTTVLIELDHHDSVWIKPDQYHSTGDLIFPGYSSFAGFLLYPRI